MLVAAVPAQPFTSLRSFSPCGKPFQLRALRLIRCSAAAAEGLDGGLDGSSSDGGGGNASEDPPAGPALAPGLYLVATPIGNLEDITMRALRVLRSADRVLCEDTRHTSRLLNHYGIRTPLESYHMHNERSKEGGVSPLHNYNYNLTKP